MKIKKNIVPEEIFLIGFLATFMGGFLDAYTYVLHDKVFANTQTGNLILLSIYLFESDFKNAILRIIPIIFFFLGIFLYEIFLKINEKYSVNISLILQAIFLILIGFGFFKNNSIIICALISFICALQLASFKKINGMPFSTIMCTGNLRSFSENLSKFVLSKNKENLIKSLIYLSVIFIFCIGVFLGMFFVKFLGQKAILILLINIFIKHFVLYMHKKHTNLDYMD